VLGFQFWPLSSPNAGFDQLHRTAQPIGVGLPDQTLVAEARGPRRRTAQSPSVPKLKGYSSALRRSHFPGTVCVVPELPHPAADHVGDAGVLRTGTRQIVGENEVLARADRGVAM